MLCTQRNLLQIDQFNLLVKERSKDILSCISYIAHYFVQRNTLNTLSMLPSISSTKRHGTETSNSNLIHKHFTPHVCGNTIKTAKQQNKTNRHIHLFTLPFSRAGDLNILPSESIVALQRCVGCPLRLHLPHRISDQQSLLR